MLTLQELEKLIEQGESAIVECKIALPRVGELAERICGMANSTRGGFLVIGVADQTWDIVGVNSVSATIDGIFLASKLCKPAVPLDSSQVQAYNLKGNKVVVARIPPNRGTLYQSGGRYFLRRETNTIPMDAEEISQFLYSGAILSWETRPVAGATLDDLNLDKVQKYLQQISHRTQRPSRVSDPVELLLKLRCAIKNEAGTIVPTNAGLLLFGFSPWEFIREAEIVATYYQDSSGVRRYTDRKILTGTIAEQIEQVEELVRLWTPVGAYVEGFHRVDEPALPLEALREAVVNAVVHRDYSIGGTAVRLFYYPDRVEIYSPGVLLPGITLEDLQQGRVGSRPRNPELANVLRDLPGGYMEKVGSGIRFMINQMRNLGLDAPRFKEQAGEVVVIFWRKSPSFLPLERRNQSEIPQTSGNKSSADPGERFIAPGLNPTPNQEISPTERKRLALQYVRQYGQITPMEYRNLTGAAETTAIRDLKNLTEQGALRAVGRGPNRRYVI